MKTEALNKLREYWESLRNGRSAPYRAELDPRKFEDVLENMFILEQLNPEQVRVRLAGMALCEMMGMEVRGMPPEAFIAAPDRQAFGSHIQTVLTGPAVIELDLMATDIAGGPVRGQMLMLPLRSDFGEVTRTLGCVVTERVAVRTPVAFSIVAQRTSIVHPSVAEEGRGGGLPGFAEPPAGFSGPASAPELRTVISNSDPVSTGRRRGHLKIVSKD